MDMKELYECVNEMMRQRGYEPLPEDEFCAFISAQMVQGKLEVAQGQIRARHHHNYYCAPLD